MVNVININILAHSVSPNGVLFAGVQGEDKATLLKVKIDGAILPTVDDGQTLRIFAEAVNGAGEYYVTEFLEIVDNVITFPIPLEITRGGGQATLNFVFAVLDEKGKQVSAKYSSEIRLRFEDSVQFYQSEYLDTMASALAELYRYRALLADYGNSQEQLDELEEQIAKLEAELSGKVDKVTGMGLSKNDFNDDYKLTLDEFPQTIESILEQVENSKCDVSNLSDGSAYGSVRGIATRAEGNGYTIGQNAVAIGYDTEAIGYISYAEGYNTTALGDYSHAEGYGTCASEGSHAEGSGSDASGGTSHAEGVSTTASGRISHAEGSGTTASGDVSHAEGASTTASGYSSHAEGESTIASGEFQHAQGKHNIADNDNKYLHIVGNGEDNENRSNAHTLDWDGNAWFAGDVYVGGTSQDDENATKLSSVATDITQVKEKLDGIEEGATKTIVDTALSTTSTNPIQNKAVAERIKNHASFLARTFPTDAVYLKLGTFIGDGLGGRAILTINGRKEWNTYEEGGLKVLTLSSSSKRISGTFYDFGCSNGNTSEIIDKTDDMEMLIVCQKDYALTKADVFIKFTTSCKYNSYFVTVDYSEGCSWVTDVQAITSTDTDPTTDAQSYSIAPTKYIADLTKVNSVLRSKADLETGTCTLSASNGTVSNATYSVVGNMVTLNFNIALTGAGNVVVSGLPFTVTKNQSGFASSTATYNITANQTSVSINSTSGTAEYCTVTYLK